MRIAALVALGVLVGACEEDTCPKIDGSLPVSYDMDFDDVRIRKFTQQIEISYVRDGTPEEVALKIAVDFTENDIRVDQPVELGDDNVDRSVQNGTTFPPICTDRPSNITFDEYGENAGDTLSGEWRLCFSTGLDGVGCFDGELQVID